MKTKDTNLVKKEIAIIVTIVALAAGFLSGIVYSAFKSPADSSQYSGSQSTGQPSQNAQQQANRILDLEKEVAANPDNIDAMIELGDIYFDSDRYQEAIVTFNKAEQIAPTNIHVLNDLGILLMNTGNYDASLEKFEAVLDIDPSHSHSLYYVGIVYRTKGETGKALEAFEQVLILDSDPQLAEAVRQEITALKDQAASSSFPQSDFSEAK